MTCGKEMKSAFPSLGLPIITEEDNDYLKVGGYSRNMMSQGGLINNLDEEESKSARSPSMLSVSPSKTSDGVLIQTKKNKKSESTVSLLGELRYAQ
jgi:hypothetical protein